MKKVVISLVTLFLVVFLFFHFLNSKEELSEISTNTTREVSLDEQSESQSSSDKIQESDGSSAFDSFSLGKTDNSESESSNDDTSLEESSDNTASSSEASSENSKMNSGNDGESSKSDASSSEDSQNSNNADDSFNYMYDEIQDKAFVFSSGAGAWSTTIVFEENGLFKGTFWDSDYGDIDGPKVYYSNFQGQFKITDEVEDRVFQLELVNLEKTISEDSFMDEDVIYEEVWPPYGLDGGKEWLMYLPFEDITNLPEEFISWTSIFVDDPTDVRIFLLRNLETNYGFVEAIE